ncbi:MAG: ThuA domain-containing protein [Bacteroidales bacterium]|nr:ThuA domain-containing protein [Bacteroidales bacterium]
MKCNRRQFLTSSAVAAVGASLGLQAKDHHQPGTGFDHPDLPALEGRKILYTFGGWSGHEPAQSVERFKPWLESEGAVVDVFDNLDPYADPEYMMGVDLVVQIFTMAEISGEQEAGLLAAVKRGVGIAGWHGGLCDSFRQNVAYQFMTGGQWVAHPGGVIDYSVQVKDPSDPVTRGLDEFHMTSEQYYMHVDPNVNVLATTTFNADHAYWIDGCTMPVVWKKMYGKGRVFYSSLGHVMKDFEVPEAFEIMKRGIKWASASKYEPSESWKNPVY